MTPQKRLRFVAARARRMVYWTWATDHRWVAAGAIELLCQMARGFDWQNAAYRNIAWGKESLEAGPPLSVVKGPGSKGTDDRLHLSFDPLEQKLDELQVYEVKTGESLKLFPDEWDLPGLLARSPAERAGRQQSATPRQENAKRNGNTVQDLALRLCDWLFVLSERPAQWIACGNDLRVVSGALANWVVDQTFQELDGWLPQNDLLEGVETARRRDQRSRS